MSSVVTYTVDNQTTEQQRSIAGLQFGIISHEQVLLHSVVELTEATIYQKGIPSANGAMDHRMGTVDRRIKCGTCKKDVRRCGGHWARIVFAQPIYHVSFFDTLRKILHCVCYNCSSLRCEQLVSCEDKMNVTQKKHRLTQIYNVSRAKKICPTCNSPLPSYSKNGYLNLACDWPPDSTFECSEEEEFCKRPFSAKIAFDILSNISNENLEFLGLDPSHSHPKNMILQSILIPPPIIRPSVMVSEGSRARGQDDLTMRIVEIIKQNEILKRALENEIADDKIRDIYDKLNTDVATYMHNTPRGRVATQRSGVPTKCLFSRLKGKQGRFRMNLMGKRVNFSGRSVISPDPTLDVDEIGVPVQMALNLTQQIIVTANNIEEMRRRVRIGGGKLEGAGIVISPDDTLINLDYCQVRDTVAENLTIGSIIERPLQTGDYLIFNRQPTLHRMGMMGHRVKIMKRGKTLRCNLAVVTPYNADFDGDEMNVHKPQSPASQVEVEMLMGVTEQLVSPQASRPVMGIVQDALVGSHLLSSPDVLLTQDEFASCLIVANMNGDIVKRLQVPPPAFLKPEKLWTGRQLIQTLLPIELSVNNGDEESLWGSVDDDGSIDTVATHPLVIRGGVYLCGQLKKSNLGISSGSLVHHLLLAVGKTRAVDFMGDLQRIVNRWLLEHGFSIGIGDCVPSVACDTSMREGVDLVLHHIDRLQADAPKWSAATISGDNDSGRQTLEKMQIERYVHRMVGGVQMSTGAIVRREMTHRNGLGAMVRSGSKGNPINICQILCCVGQNCVNGERLTCEGSDSRTLPSYAHGDSSVDGSGFVANSYLLGLTAAETFFHAKGGREGLVDTAVKTSRTGYYQRKLIKSTESHQVKHDLSVRDPSLNIIEFIYGGDGISPTMLEQTPFDAFAMGNDELKANVCNKANVCKASKEIQLKEYRALVLLRQEVRLQRLHIFTNKIPTSTNLAVNPRRILHLATASTASTNSNQAKKKDTLNAKHIFDSVSELCETIKQDLTDTATLCLRLVLQYELRSAQVMAKIKTKSAWQKVLETIERTILTSLAESGEMVGCIAAQSIGEPATQMTLNTFHLVLFPLTA